MSLKSKFFDKDERLFLVRGSITNLVMIFMVITVSVMIITDFDPSTYRDLGEITLTLVALEFGLKHEKGSSLETYQKYTISLTKSIFLFFFLIIIILFAQNEFTLAFYMIAGTQLGLIFSRLRATIFPLNSNKNDNIDMGIINHFQALILIIYCIIVCFTHLSLDPNTEFINQDSLQLINDLDLGFSILLSFYISVIDL